MYKLTVSLAIIAFATPAISDTCSNRSSFCFAACTPELVQSGAQAGGTVPGCRASCQLRLSQCMKSGVWVHMGSARRGEQERVDRQ